MKSDHFEELKTAIETVIHNNPDMYKSYIERGLSNMRYRWDLLWASKFDVGKWYYYLNDTHIDTALRKITNTL
jgi:hypothetical protein